MIYYLAHYTDNNHPNEYSFNAASCSKIEYIAKILLEKDNVTIFSCMIPAKGKRLKKDLTKVIYEKNGHKLTVKYLRCSHSVFKPLFVIQRFLFLKKIQNKIAQNLSKDQRSSVIIYHSLGLLKIENFFSSQFNQQTVIEVEDVYSYTFEQEINNVNRIKKKEIDALKKFSRAITITNFVAKDFGYENYVVSNGILEPSFNPDEIKKDKKIRMIYSGIIEDNYNAADCAVTIMNYMPNNYELYLCGFGKDNAVNKLTEKINNINRSKGYGCIHFLGMIKGRELETLYKKCDIGLSIERKEAPIERQKYSFHSKIFRYLTNGLAVVAGNYSSENNSDIKELINFVNIDDDYEDIAERIVSLEINKRSIYNKLILMSNEIEEQLKKLVFNE